MMISRWDIVAKAGKTGRARRQQRARRDQAFWVAAAAAVVVIAARACQFAAGLGILDVAKYRLKSIGGMTPDEPVVSGDAGRLGGVIRRQARKRSRQKRAGWTTAHSIFVNAPIPS